MSIIKSPNFNCFSLPACIKLGHTDIVFLIDGSGSIGADEFVKMKEFMINIVNKMTTGSDRVRIGLIQFFKDPKEEFPLNEYPSEELHERIREMKQLGGGTETGKALNYAANYFDKLTVSQTGATQFLIVVTDGKSQDGVLIPAKNIRDKQVTVLAVGIREANITQLLEIGGAGDKINYIENFDLLNGLVEKISWKMCITPDEKFGKLI